MHDAKIAILKDPAGLQGVERTFVPAGGKLFDFLLERYEHGFTVPTDVYHNGARVDLSERTDDGLPLKANDLVVIVHRPQSDVEEFVKDTAVDIYDASFGFITNAVWSAAEWVFEQFLPEPPTFGGNDEESPNNRANSINGQTNLARVNERIPDIFGRLRVWPDLIAPSYSEYVGGVQVQTEFLCIGTGEYLVEQAKAGETLLTEIAGTEATVYPPNTAPADVLAVSESDAINRQRLYFLDEVEVILEGVEVDFVSSNTIRSDSDALVAFGNLEAGDEFTLSDASFAGATVVGAADIDFAGDQITAPAGLGVFNVGEYVTISGTTSDDGVVEVAVSSATQLDCIDPITGDPIAFVGEVGTSATLTTVADNNGTFIFQNFYIDVNSYAVEVLGAPFDAARALQVTAESVDFLENESDLVTLAGRPVEVWFDVVLPQGLRTNDNKTASIEFELVLQQLNDAGDPVAAPQIQNEIVSGTTPDAQFYTFKMTPASIGSRYAARLRVITPYADKLENLTILFTRLASVEDYSGLDLGDVTTVLVRTQANAQTANQRRRNFNAIVTRKLRTYDLGTQSIVPALEPTARFADAMLEILTSERGANKPLSEIDLDELYTIQATLDSDPIYGDTLGRFCYSFSSKSLPLGDQLRTVAAAVRCFYYREGELVRFVRDEVRPNRVTLWNRRNKQPDSEQKTIQLYRSNESDGIELQWQDEDTGDEATIYVPADQSAVNPKRIKTAGVRNFAQAWNMAQYQYNKLVYQRTSVKVNVTDEGIIARPNDRVANVDTTDTMTSDGEVVAFDGLTVTTNEPVDFAGGGAAVLLRDKDGSVSDLITATPHPDTEFGFVLAELPPFDLFLRGENDGEFLQVGCLYTFHADNNSKANDYLVTVMSPQSDGYVEVSMVNYDERVYQADTQEPPTD